MVRDADVHRNFDHYADGTVRIGELPPGLHVTGKMAWYVYRGPYSGIGHAFGEYMRKAIALRVEPVGAPGDVYICEPDDHKADGQAKLLTLFWTPVK